MPPVLVYSRHYDLGPPGLGRLHPFDVRKYGRAYRELRRRLGRRVVGRATVRPRRAMTRDDLLAVHSAAYLDRDLRSPAYLAGAVEVPQLARVPAPLTDRLILRHMRWACAGTLLAGRVALGQGGIAFNLGGGYHHAAPDRGHGFCLYADVALMVAHLRRDGSLAAGDRVLHIDCDAHQGDGVCHCFAADRNVFLLDLYNRLIFPYDAAPRRRVDCDLPLAYGCASDVYLRTLTTELPRFLSGASASRKPRLAVYNAGTDVLDGDRLGRLRVSADAVRERDRFVLGELIDRGIPCVVLTSGGYTRESYGLVADAAEWLLTRDAP